MTPVKFSNFLQEEISNSHLEIILKAGHFVFQEAPEKVNDTILQFLNRGLS